MSSIDAAIIKALVEHIGGNSDSIPDGTIGGKTYTEGDGINIVNDTISVEYDTNTMELKNGKLAAKACAPLKSKLVSTPKSTVSSLRSSAL